MKKYPKKCAGGSFREV